MFKCSPKTTFFSFHCRESSSESRPRRWRLSAKPNSNRDVSVGLTAAAFEGSGGRGGPGDGAGCCHGRRQVRPATATAFLSPRDLATDTTCTHNVHIIVKTPLKTTIAAHSVTDHIRQQAGGFKGQRGGVILNHLLLRRAVS